MTERWGTFTITLYDQPMGGPFLARYRSAFVRSSAAALSIMASLASSVFWIWDFSSSCVLRNAFHSDFVVP